MLGYYGLGLLTGLSVAAWIWLGTTIEPLEPTDRKATAMPTPTARTLVMLIVATLALAAFALAFHDSRVITVHTEAVR